MINPPQSIEPGKTYTLSGRVPARGILQVVDAHTLRVIAKISPKVSHEFERHYATFKAPEDVWMISVQWSDGVINPVLTLGGRMTEYTA